MTVLSINDEILDDPDPEHLMACSYSIRWFLGRVAADDRYNVRALVTSGGAGNLGTLSSGLSHLWCVGIGVL